MYSAPILFFFGFCFFWAFALSTPWLDDLVHFGTYAERSLAYVSRMMVSNPPGPLRAEFLCEWGK